MVAIAATNSTTPSLQLALSQARLEQARREADQAEANAKDLRNQADQAQQDSEQRQNRVQSLSTEVSQEQPTYRVPSKAGASEVPPQTQDFLIRLYKATRQQFAASGNALKSSPDAPSVLNSQGQATGRILNITA